MRFRQPNVPVFLIALLVVTAVATVLITPDPTDDVHAILGSHQTLHAPAATFLLLPLLALLMTGKPFGSQTELAAAGKSLQLLCTCRC